ncbi:MAG: hypothetical protein ACXWQO_08590 [Bdellovibrionota bacterium]
MKRPTWTLERGADEGNDEQSAGLPIVTRKRREAGEGKSPRSIWGN